MFKTIITIPNYQPLPQEAQDQIQNEIAVMIESSKYTGGQSQELDPVTGIKTVERFQWVDEVSAQDYVDVAIAAITPTCPGTQSQILSI